MLANASAAEVYDRCVIETVEYVVGSGFHDVVIGLSGGLDSSLVATMAVDGLGAEHVHGILLPGPYSSESSLVDAEALATNLGIETVTMGIGDAYDAFSKTFSEGYGEGLEGLASENTQARCRMVLIMAASNAFGWMMLNTGNKSEAAMGYSTLYGDTAGAFAPIGGVYKTDVFELARWRNAHSDGIEALRKRLPSFVDDGSEPVEHPIPENVIEKPPSAELSPGQTDEGSLGVDYPTLDRILIGCIEGSESNTNDGACAPGYDQHLVEGIVKRYRSYAFKRAMEPPYPAIGYGPSAPNGMNRSS